MPVKLCKNWQREAIKAKTSAPISVNAAVAPAVLLVESTVSEDTKKLMDKKLKQQALKIIQHIAEEYSSNKNDGDNSDDLDNALASINTKIASLKLE